MKINSMYGIKIREHGYNRLIADSVRIYRNVVDYLIDVCVSRWSVLSSIEGQQFRKSAVERLVHGTKNNPAPEYNDFDTRFYKLPSYLRRSAIAEALGKASSYMSNLENWKTADPKTRGCKPGYPKAGYIYPCLYRGDMFIRQDAYTAMIKVYVRNTWDWITVSLRKSDADYIFHHCSDRKEDAPVLQKRGKCWYLNFCYEENVTLRDTDIFNQTIVAVDLGINSPCTCSVMKSDGTILGRHFLKLPKEYDSLRHKTDHIRKAQHQGSRDVHVLWKFADGVNDDISEKTAQFIVDTARRYQADVIVFEHLDTSGRIHGSRRTKIKLHLWRKQEVQRIVTDKAHCLGIRISRICAWGTSKLAFDGSGTVKRGSKSEKTNGCYSVCEFANGKIYNCDLNASYNIGARYFVREILQSLPAKEERRIRANVPGCDKRSTCTLSTLISLNGALAASAA